MVAAAGALEARQIDVDPERYDVEEVERVHGFHARFCPVARSLEGGIDVRTEL